MGLEDGRWISVADALKYMRQPVLEEMASPLRAIPWQWTARPLRAVPWLEEVLESHFSSGAGKAPDAALSRRYLELMIYFWAGAYVPNHFGASPGDQVPYSAFQPEIVRLLGFDPSRERRSPKAEKDIARFFLARARTEWRFLFMEKARNTAKNYQSLFSHPLLEEDIFRITKCNAEVGSNLRHMARGARFRSAGPDLAIVGGAPGFDTSPERGFLPMYTPSSLIPELNSLIVFTPDFVDRGKWSEGLSRPENRAELSRAFGGDRTELADELFHGDADLLRAVQLVHEYGHVLQQKMFGDEFLFDRQLAISMEKTFRGDGLATAIRAEILDPIYDLLEWGARFFSLDQMAGCL